MRTGRILGWSLLGLGSALVFNACGSDDSGGGGKGGTDGGKKDGGIGGTGGFTTGGTGGSSATGGKGGTGGGGTGGSGGCKPEPPPGETACGDCQDQEHALCETACADELNACLQDAECGAIYTCAYGDGSGDPPCPSIDAEGAACVLACIAKNPAGKDLYLAQDKCIYCQFCVNVCEGAEYCAALDGPTDGGTDAATDATTSDAPDDTSSDDGATTSDAASESATD